MTRVTTTLTQKQPTEEPHDMRLLKHIQDCVSVGKSGMTIDEVFKRLDNDSGGIAVDTFATIVQAYSQTEQSDADVHRLFLLVNSSGSGTISFSEFVSRFG